MLLEVAPHHGILSRCVPQFLHREVMSSSLSVARTLHLRTDIFRGSPLNGPAARVAVAAAALIRSPAALRHWRARQRKQAQAAHEPAAAHEQAETTRLDRRRAVSGWSAHGIDTRASP